MIPRALVVTTALLFAVALGMGFYVAQLRRRADIASPRTLQAEHVRPPAAGPAENVTVWVAHDDDGKLHAQSLTVPLSSERQPRADDLLRALLNIYQSKDSPHRVGAGAEIREVYLVDPGLAVIDLNAAFADGQTSGILAEELTLVSIVQTLSNNIPGITKVKFLVDGKERDTLAGHADLSGFYAVSSISGLAKQLSEE